MKNCPALSYCFLHMRNCRSTPCCCLLIRRHRNTYPSLNTSTMSLATAQYEFTDEETQLPPIKYEYLDHTADVQLHAWGDSLQEAFEQCAMAMFAYMTDIEYVDLQEAHKIEAQGDDLESLLFHFLDEFLFLFSCEPFLIARKVKIIEFDSENFRIVAKGYGEKFDLSKHPQGTEVKAITYSNLQVHDKEESHEVFVIIDI